MKRAGWQRVVVAASGPSLTEDVAARCLELATEYKLIAVNDAWRRIPFADALYANDRRWWEYHAADLERFQGERWTSTSTSPFVDDDKLAWARREELRISVVEGKAEPGFSAAPGVIHYGNNSGFQAVNLAVQFGAQEVRLAGFDMRRVGPQAHFFGDHPPELDLGGTIYERFVADFNTAAESLPEGLRVVNCTPGSAIRCFPFEGL